MSTQKALGSGLVRSRDVGWMWGFTCCAPQHSLSVQSSLCVGRGWRCRECTSKHGAYSFLFRKHQKIIMEKKKREWKRKGGCNMTRRPIFTIVCHLRSEQMKYLWFFSAIYVLLHVNVFKYLLCYLNTDLCECKKKLKSVLSTRCFSAFPLRLVFSHHN